MSPRNRVRAAIVALGFAATVLGCLIPGTGALATDKSELQRRLALPPFAYVAEHDTDTTKIQQGQIVDTGAAAFIDSATDSLVARPAFGSNPQGVAVAPDGSKIYLTDAYEPVLHVLDAESKAEIASIPLPGVEPHDVNAFSRALQSLDTKFSHDLWRSCATGVACTPDGTMVLVCSSAGLQVVDAATNKVVRTLPDLFGGALAVSFDGTRAYVAADDFDQLPDRTYFEWLRTWFEAEDNRLVCLDLRTWEVVAEIRTAVVASVAVKPDDSQVFFSETYKERVRVVDALTLADLWDVSTEPSYSVGIGFLPSGEKAYVVCSAESILEDFEDMMSGKAVPTIPKAQDFFCAVIDTAAEEIVKRIPLEAY